MTAAGDFHRLPFPVAAHGELIDPTLAATPAAPMRKIMRPRTQPVGG
jgi:hypothetical protein